MSFGSKAALETAVQIAEWLCHTAYQCQGLCNWMGTTQQADEDSEALEIAYETLGPDLYGGTSGVSLFLAETYAAMVEQVSRHLRRTGKITVAEARDLFATSRKYALALMEHLDAIGVTKRVGDERTLKA